MHFCDALNKAVYNSLCTFGLFLQFIDDGYQQGSFDIRDQQEHSLMMRFLLEIRKERLVSKMVMM